MEDDLKGFIVGIFIGAFILGIFCGLFPQNTRMYREGVKITHKEAYEHGFMTKEITKDDQVVYKWKNDLNDGKE